MQTAIIKQQVQQVIITQVAMADSIQTEVRTLEGKLIAVHSTPQPKNPEPPATDAK